MSTTYDTLTNTTFPDNIQTFRNSAWQDLAESDAANYVAYMNAIADKNTTLAKSALTAITDYSKKIITAADFNTICDTILAVEKFYSEAESGTGTFETILANFAYRGVYNSGTQYYRFNLVNYNSATYGSGIYVALQNNIGVAPTDASTDTNWRRISTSAVLNVGTTWQGNWSSDTTYNEGSMVSHNNQWWLCNTNGTTAEPSASASAWDSIIDFSIYRPIVRSTAPESTEQSTGGFWYHIL